jgi:hypothetical protein
MECRAEVTDEFGDWWSGVTAEEQEDVRAGVKLLQEKSVGLRFPNSSGVTQSKHEHMRELRIQHGGRPYRVLYAFDPRRVALPLIGGDKTGDDRWYDVIVPVADRLYDEHLESIAKGRVAEEWLESFRSWRRRCLPNPWLGATKSSPDCARKWRSTS